MKCQPCSTLPDLLAPVLSYLDMVGAGHLQDDSVRFADNLGNMVVGWSMSEVRAWHSGEYILTGSLKKDLLAAAQITKFHSGTLWIIGDDAKTYGLGQSFADTQ